MLAPLGYLSLCISVMFNFRISVFFLCVLGALDGSSIKKIRKSFLPVEVKFHFERNLVPVFSKKKGKSQ
jgi:hypothetical protein